MFGQYRVRDRWNIVAVVIFAVVVVIIVVVVVVIIVIDVIVNERSGVHGFAGGVEMGWIMWEDRHGVVYISLCVLT